MATAPASATRSSRPSCAALVSASAKSGKLRDRGEGQAVLRRRRRSSVENIDVPDGSNATATVKEANGNVSKVFLVKQGGQWRIRSVTPA